MRSSVFIGKTMIGQALLHYFSKTKDYRVVMPENWVSKLNSHTGLGLYVGSPLPKKMSEMTVLKQGYALELQKLKDYFDVLIQHRECELYFLCFAGDAVLYLICTICIFSGYIEYIWIQYIWINLNWVNFDFDELN